MKGIRLLLTYIFISIVILVGCSQSKPEETNKLEKSNTLLVSEEIEETSEVLEEEKNLISPADLSTEEKVREYLVGDWTCKIDYMSNIVANMNVYENLDVQLTFHDTFTNESKGEYKGKINFKRIYASPVEAPDIISIELDDDYYATGDFFFLHRTIYDEKRVMSLFFTGNGESVFNILIGYDDEDYDYIIEEIMLEKETGEISRGRPRKNDAFYAVFWDHGELYESIWLDDVDWTPPMEDDPILDYPLPMTLYENEKYESILYNVNSAKQFEVLGDNMFKGTVYYVETDEKGNLVELIDADYKKYLEEFPKDEDFYNDFYDQPEYFFEEGSEEYIDSEFADLIFSFLEDIVEVQEYLDTGMSILFTGETIIIHDEECYFVFLGTNLEESFVREIHYAVNTNTGQVYRYDILNDIWDIMSAG